MNNSPTGHDVVRVARQWIGTPYQHQASLMGVGCDCLGLVRGVWRSIVGREPENPPSYTSSWAEFDGSEKLLAAANRHFLVVEDGVYLPGDVLVFRLKRKAPAKHIAIYSGGNQFIHAYDGTSVVENCLSEFWSSRICAIFHFPGVSI